MSSGVQKLTAISPAYANLVARKQAEVAARPESASPSSSTTTKPSKEAKSSPPPKRGITKRRHQPASLFCKSARRLPPSPVTTQMNRETDAQKGYTVVNPTGEVKIYKQVDTVRINRWRKKTITRKTPVPKFLIQPLPEDLSVVRKPEIFEELMRQNLEEKQRLRETGELS